MRPLTVLLVLMVPSVALRAAELSTAVSGTFDGAQENACVHISKFIHLTDCSYGRTNQTVAGNELSWNGPRVNTVYYSPDSPHAAPTYTPELGDDRISPSVDGTITIDDQGTADPTDDLISATLTVGPAARNVVVGVTEPTAGAPPRAVESWSSISHTLAPIPVDETNVNALGGIDYVVGSKGFPTRICQKDDPEDCFPSARAPKVADGAQLERWAEPGSAPITRDSEMGGNVGATTTAVITDYKCIDNRENMKCPDFMTLWGGTSEDPGFDNLLLRVSTNGQGRVVNVQGFWTNEYRQDVGPPIYQVADGHDNAWQGGYLQLTGTAAE